MRNGGCTNSGTGAGHSRSIGGDAGILPCPGESAQLAAPSRRESRCTRKGGPCGMPKLPGPAKEAEKGDWLFGRADECASARGESDRKSTRLNSSHLGISYAVFC